MPLFVISVQGKIGHVTISYKSLLSEFCSRTRSRIKPGMTNNRHAGLDPASQEIEEDPESSSE